MPCISNIRNFVVPVYSHNQVMCVMGRTGTLHAWQQEPNFPVPDIQTIGKSLGGGYIPLSAVLLSSHVVRTLSSNSTRIAHSQTFQVSAPHPLPPSSLTKSKGHAVSERGTKNIPVLFSSFLLTNIIQVGKVRYPAAQIYNTVLHPRLDRRISHYCVFISCHNVANE